MIGVKLKVDMLKVFLSAATWFFRKVPNTYVGAKRASSTQGIGETRYTHVKNWI